MFSAEFVSSRSGISSKSGLSWYRLELIADTISGNAKIIQVFCSESAYNQCVGMQSRQRIRVSCGVNDNGYITINAVRSE